MDRRLSTRSEVSSTELFFLLGPQPACLVIPRFNSTIEGGHRRLSPSDSELFKSESRGPEPPSAVQKLEDDVTIVTGHQSGDLIIII